MQFRKKMQLRKILLVSGVTIPGMLLGGCSVTPGAGGTEMDAPASDVKYVTNVEFTGTEAAEAQDNTGTEDDTVNHTLYDGSVTFTDDVAVLYYSDLDAYVPEENKFTLCSYADVGDCVYAYVYYTKSLSEYFFQRIEEKGTDENGDTWITLSGTPLAYELPEEDILSLIAHYKVEGNTVGEESDAFEDRETTDPYLYE